MSDRRSTTEGLLPANGSTRSQLSERLQNITTELIDVETRLRSGEIADAALLLELREALDNLRLTAWTASELQRAREMNTNTRELLSFLAAERVRRLTRLASDLTNDLDNVAGYNDSEDARVLYQALSRLQERLVE